MDNFEQTKSVINTSPFGSELNATEVVAQLQKAGGWENRYRAIIQLGKKIPPLSNEQKQESNLVHGCESQVWLISFYDKDEQQMLYLVDSDARIVKGLIALALAAFQQKTPEYIAAFDIEKYFIDMELGKHLSPSRSNGLKTIITQMQDAARAQI